MKSLTFLFLILFLWSSTTNAFHLRRRRRSSSYDNIQSVLKENMDKLINKVKDIPAFSANGPEGEEEENPSMMETLNEMVHWFDYETLGDKILECDLTAHICRFQHPVEPIYWRVQYLDDDDKYTVHEKKEGKVKKYSYDNCIDISNVITNTDIECDKKEDTHMIKVISL